MSTKLRDINQFHPINNMNNFDYHQYMIKAPYDMYYTPGMIEGMKNQGYPMENQQMYLRMNSKF
jgi:hypothetical protein